MWYAGDDKEALILLMTMRNISVVTGDLLESKAQTLVNTVNCVGVMGKGIALEFKKHFPDMYADYERRCAAGLVRLREPYLYKRVTIPWILNFPTKGHWRSVSKLSDIVAGLDFLRQNYKEWGIQSIAVPPLGCGNGQLEWNIVGPTIYRAFESFDVPVELFAPFGTPAAQMTEAFLGTNEVRHLESNRSRKVDPALVALVGVISRIYNEQYHWPLGRIAVQKIAYFLTEAGVPTGLQFRRGSYGPFSPNLKRALANLQNHQLVTERQVGKTVQVCPGPTYRDARAMYMTELKGWSEQIERVADLFLRLSSTNDMEVAATIHFATKELAALNEPVAEIQVLDEVLDWKKRRRPPLRREVVAESIRSLNMLGWISASASDELPLLEDCFA
jgi:O-acetyl-ADP-ribose deacetylase (regulator of RNase III)/uncharacterized protein YwgA